MELPEPIRRTVVNTIKFLAIDAIEKANSGHPGMPMGCAALTVELWTRHLRYSPVDPHWPGRDRFVLSAGHGSMLLYSMLHLSGYNLPMSELERFRQLDSKTPGHPEVHHTEGVETTTGPLGQGLANAVGMAIAAKMMAARFPEQGLVAQRIFGICSDGDLMEGISHEACSLAGHLGLGNLKFFYDDNLISLAGKTSVTLSDDAKMRFEAYGWFVQKIDGSDPVQIRKALDAAVAENDRPSLIIARTHIGEGSPNKHDSEKAHGSPLGKAETELTKQALGWPLSPTFLVPDEVRDVFRRRAEENAKDHQAWQTTFAALPPERRALWDVYANHTRPADLFDQLLAEAQKHAGKPEATRALAGKIEQVVAKICPWLVGGSADLDPSTNTHIDGSGDCEKGKFDGRNIHFGVREHAMGAINNGITVHGGLVAFGATFLVFADYERPAIRLAALMELPAIFVFTHDSIFLGEDGPTHQPIETLAALRLIPNLRVVRPADAIECAAAWTYALEHDDGPTALIFSRQKLTPIERPAGHDAKEALQGAYRVVDPASPKLRIIATGSEVSLAIDASRVLAKTGIEARVISAPCLEALEDAGTEAYASVMGHEDLPTVSIEAGRTTPWRAVVGPKGLTIGVDTFGASAPDKDLAVRFGLTVEAVTEKIRAWLK